MLRDEPKLPEQTEVLHVQSEKKDIDHKGDKMSKIKDQMDRDYQQMMDMDVSFAEFLDSLPPRVYEVETTEEEEDSIEKPSTASTSIVPANTLNTKDMKPVNNPYYYPTRRIK